MLKWHISYWWFWVALFGVYMVYRIILGQMTWDSIVAIVLFLLAVSIPSIRWLILNHRKRALFRPEYTKSQTERSSLHEVEAQQKIQFVQTTLSMELETNVEFVGFYFEGQGKLPVIKRLYDWQWDKNKIPPYVWVYSVPNDPEAKGKWYWQYKNPWHRLKDSRITIGIDFLATDYFDGYLVFGVNCKEGGKRQYLPFKVKKRFS